MKCRNCDGKLIKTSDFSYEEITSLKTNELNNYALVLIEKRTDFLGLKKHKKSINFRKIKEIDGDIMKLYGIKEPFNKGVSQIIRETETITYRLLKLTEAVKSIIVKYIESYTAEDFSNTKLNNYLGKCKELEQFMTVDEEKDDFEKEWNDFPFDVDDDFPF